MLRLFVALPLPLDLRRRLGSLGGGIPGARWVGEDNLHLTIRFIGDVEGSREEDIVQALADIEAPAFTVTLEGFGTFAKGSKVHTLWAGVAAEDGLKFLRDKVESALVRVGLEPEHRKFMPHITVARMGDVSRERLGAFLSGHSLFRAGPISMDRFVLFSSLRGQGGPVYRPEAEYLLSNGASP